VIAELARHAPMVTRGYVTVTRIVDRSQLDALYEELAAMSANLARMPHDEPAVLPPGARPTHPGRADDTRGAFPWPCAQLHRAVRARRPSIRTRRRQQGPDALVRAAVIRLEGSRRTAHFLGPGKSPPQHAPPIRAGRDTTPARPRRDAQDAGRA
jgi:hypothetical protein